MLSTGTEWKGNWLNTEKLMLLKTVVLEKTLESPLDCKVIQPVHPKGNQSWIFVGRTDAEAEAPILWLLELKSWLIVKDPRDGRGWDGWMASPTQSTWVWVNSRSRWWTGKPGVLQSMGSHRVVHGWVTELNWTDRKLLTCHPQLYSVPQGEDCVTQYAKTQIIWSKLWFTEGLILAKGFSLLKPHPKPNLWARWRLL